MVVCCCFSGVFVCLFVLFNCCRCYFYLSPAFAKDASDSRPP